MPRPANTSAACASTYSRRASCGRTSSASSVFAKALVEAFENAHELGLQLEDFDDRIVAQLLHPLQRVGDGEVAVVEPAVDLVPFDRHRHRRARRWAHAVGR